MRKDHYRVLGVSPAATQETIHDAFLRLAKRYYPPTGSDPDALARWQKIAEAWQVLNDPARRRLYDARRKSRRRSWGLSPLGVAIFCLVIASIAIFFVFGSSIAQVPTGAPTLAAMVRTEPTRAPTATLKPTLLPTATLAPDCAQGCTQAVAGCTIKATEDTAQGTRTYYLPEDPVYGDIVLNLDSSDRWFCKVQDAAASGYTRFVLAAEPTATPTVSFSTTAPIRPTVAPVVSLKPRVAQPTPASAAFQNACGSSACAPTPTQTATPAAPNPSVTGFKYPAPRLMAPQNLYHYSCNDKLQLSWTLTDNGPVDLGENEWFLLESRQADHPNWFGIADWTKDQIITLNPGRARGGCDAPWWFDAGAYEWRVIVVLGDKSQHALKGLLSPASEAYIINYSR